MEKSAHTYTITEETLDKVKAELMEQFDKYTKMGIKAKDEEERLSSITGFKVAESLSQPDGVGRVQLPSLVLVQAMHQKNKMY